MPTYLMVIQYLKNKTGWNPPRFQSGLAVALAVGTLVWAGCSKGKKTAAEPPPPTAQELQQAEIEHKPVPSPTTAVAIAPLATPTGQPDLAEMNRTMIRWIVGHRRPPANFEEFAATAGVAIPPPPAGQKYIIAKNMHVQLVSK
jgi:hypothetical protein